LLKSIEKVKLQRNERGEPNMSEAERSFESAYDNKVNIPIKTHYTKLVLLLLSTDGLPHNKRIGVIHK
jgi:hypothetical protein